MAVQHTNYLASRMVKKTTIKLPKKCNTVTIKHFLEVCSDRILCSKMHACTRARMKKATVRTTSTIVVLSIITHLAIGAEDSPAKMESFFRSNKEINGMD